VDEVHQWVRLPKLGWVPYRNGMGRHALKLAGKVRSVAVPREGRHWFVSVLCAQEVAEPTTSHAVPVGGDLGVA
jgi:hypothetical protein